MSKKSVICVVTTRNQAEQLVARLKAESFPNNSISVLFPDKAAARGVAHENNTKVASGGVVVAGASGWIAGIGPLAIPGVGPFIAAGPVMAALTGAVFSASIGIISRGLEALGLSKVEAVQFETKVRQGRFLISVHTDDVGDIARARAFFTQAGAQDICTTGETSRPADGNGNAANETSLLAETAAAGPSQNN